MPLVSDLVLGTAALVGATEPQRQEPARSPQLFDGLMMPAMFEIPHQLFELSVELLLRRPMMTLRFL